MATTDTHSAYTASRQGARRRLWPRILLIALLVLASIAAIAFFANRTAINGYAVTGAAYAARVGCSCRYIGGRPIGDCAKDKVAGMELVRLSDDPATKSVTATFPLLASQTATYREGYGCVLEKWED
ncbi:MULTISPECIES: hypothetical protein [unclassified Citromicrobium]|uniref:hypothetical protein n=1 Tax=unclassified Citromicrobium TaxID=2630544 RepID=UPI0006C928EE|nr:MULTISPECIES: hypothetical protein [unclassified Citromicrobium]MAY76283.1 hypothetical protein [Citromicrobium sp.]OAM06903.1 hypothetical protein A0U43_14960 [Citromicrobium sp. RCC1897]